MKYAASAVDVLAAIHRLVHRGDHRQEIAAVGRIGAQADRYVEIDLVFPRETLIYSITLSDDGDGMRKC